MINIFKKNKVLLEENRTLKAQIEALKEFRKGFDEYYHSISSHKIVEKRYNNVIVVRGAFNFDNINTLHYPTDYCKKEIIDKIAQQLEPYVEFDVVDNNAYGTKTLVGKLMITKGE